MAIQFLLGEGGFKTEDEIKQIVQSLPNVNHEGESTAEAQTMVIFKTSKQQTWLVTTNLRLYCVLDDVDRKFTNVQWWMNKDKLIDPSGNVAAQIGARERSTNSGLLDIGERRGWLYSKQLFANEPITNQVARAIKDKMGTSDPTA
jgi:hypothetical protein